MYSFVFFCIFIYLYLRSWKHYASMVLLCTYVYDLCMPALLLFSIYTFHVHNSLNIFPISFFIYRIIICILYFGQVLCGVHDFILCALNYRYHLFECPLFDMFCAVLSCIFYFTSKVGHENLLPKIC